MALELAPLQEEHWEAAAHLVAARYADLRGQVPEVTDEFTRVDAVLPRLRNVAGGGPGMAALDRGELVGFLTAYLVPFRSVRTAYVPDCAHGAVRSNSRTIYRRLYASLAQRWLEHGCFQHAVTCMAHETAVMDAWFSLGFGMFVVDALRTTAGSAPSDAPWQIRRLGSEDAETLAPLEMALSRHLAAAPIFIPLVLESTLADRRRWLADGENALWIASQADEPVGFLCMERAEYPMMAVSGDDVVAVTGAYTVEAVRGQGVAGALLQTALAWAREAGYRRCSVDFESANLPGSAFWLGPADFTPVCYSLQRRVDERLAWAGSHRAADQVERIFNQGSALG